jgi:hypothetical protein
MRRYQETHINTESFEDEADTVMNAEDANKFEQAVESMNSNQENQ